MSASIRLSVHSGWVGCQGFGDSSWDRWVTAVHPVCHLIQFLNLSSSPQFTQSVTMSGLIGIVTGWVPCCVPIIQAGNYIVVALSLSQSSMPTIYLVHPIHWHLIQFLNLSSSVIGYQCTAFVRAEAFLENERLWHLHYQFTPLPRK